MEEKKVLSICIPTNGVCEWVFPVIESIVSQDCDPSKYEIVVTDNGDNEEFEKRMRDYTREHSNIVYTKTSAKGFLNQIESFKLAGGSFVKFQNHRMTLVEGALKRLIDFAEDNKDNKANVFFLNGNLPLPDKVECRSLDEFARNLSFFSSWSGGLAFWKDRVEGALDLESYDELFPHMDILFFRQNDSHYVIDNTVIARDIKTDHSKKGRYNLFYAFAVHYIDYLKAITEQGSISKDTFESIKTDNQRFITDLYRDFVIMKKPCSYDLTDSEKNIAVYYNFDEVLRTAKRKAFIQRIKDAVKICIGRR